MSVTRVEHLDEDVTHVFEVAIIDAETANGNDDRCARPLRKASLLKVQVFLTHSVIVWSLCELVLEVIAEPTAFERAAVVIGRAVWIFLAVGTLRKRRLSKLLFLFLCGASVIAVTVQLPAVFETSRIFFGVSIFDCMAKIATLFAYLL
jgi:hypothetical protein